MSHNCHSHCCHATSVSQTLDELDFERGIWSAASNNDLSRAEFLINKSNNVDIEDKAGYTALHYSSRNGHLEMCKLLISKGANVNALTRSGRVTALHRCASRGHLEVFNLLVNSGAKFDLQDSDGKTVLHRAVEGGHINIVKEILKLCPQLTNCSDNRGRVPKDYVQETNVLYKMLD
ncbi:hypothetical protein RUM44_007180 [Polyplax serrata]|uniref:Ankyrin repeat domain-containing protein 39 n=1 Tax=Polyplax serrata TaxID=468196 RepID=A0ABR1AZZ5_POLSC